MKIKSNGRSECLFETDVVSTPAVETHLLLVQMTLALQENRAHLDSESFQTNHSSLLLKENI